jgi:hypothetical protein
LIEWTSQVAEGIVVIFVVAAIGMSIWSFKKQSIAESDLLQDAFDADIKAQALQLSAAGLVRRARRR